jgi:hypothetical protein
MIAKTILRTIACALSVYAAIYMIAGDINWHWNSIIWNFTALCLWVSILIEEITE